MTGTLDYAHPTVGRPNKALRRVAFLSLLLPLIVLASLYGEWLLATWSLGHVPRPSLDDPKDIAGSSWMHIITGLAIMGAVPAGLLEFVLNVVEIAVNRPTLVRGVARMAVVIVSWVALFVLLRWDPGAVLYWWFD